MREPDARSRSHSSSCASVISPGRTALLSSNRAGQSVYCAKHIYFYECTWETTPTLFVQEVHLHRGQRDTSRDKGVKAYDVLNYGRAIEVYSVILALLTA